MTWNTQPQPEQQGYAGNFAYAAAYAAGPPGQFAVGGYTAQQMVQPMDAPLAAPPQNNPWPIADSLEQKYEHLNVVGVGVYHTVYKARNRGTEELVAIKKIRCEEEYDQGAGVPAQVLREVACLRDFTHPNIVQLKDIFITDIQDYSLVFEFVQLDLHKLLKGFRERDQKMPMDLVIKYTGELLAGIHACHVRLILHRDLKPQNILIGADGLKIGDFGLARMFASPIRNYTLDVITLWYRAPEILLGTTRYGPEVDMWSAGVIITEMATGRALFPGDSEIGTIFKIFKIAGTPSETTWPGLTQLEHWKVHFPHWPPTEFQSVQDDRPELGEHGMALIRGLLALNPQSRFGARRAKNSTFAKAIPEAANTQVA